MNKLSKLISCQGLIAQFSRPAVRGSFRKGELGVVNHVEDILSSMQKFRDVIPPSPGITTETPDVSEGCSAILFAVKLLSLQMLKEVPFLLVKSFSIGGGTNFILVQISTYSAASHCPSAFRKSL